MRFDANGMYRRNGSICSKRIIFLCSLRQQSLRCHQAGRVGNNFLPGNNVNGEPGIVMMMGK